MSLFGVEAVKSFEDATVPSAVSEVEVISAKVEFTDDGQGAVKELTSVLVPISQLGNDLRKEAEDESESTVPARGIEEAKNSFEGVTELEYVIDEELELAKAVATRTSGEEKHDTVAKVMTDEELALAKAVETKNSTEEKHVKDTQLNCSEVLSVVTDAEKSQFQEDLRLQEYHEGERSFQTLLRYLMLTFLTARG